LNFLYFIRLLLKHIALLIIMPIVFVAIVFFLTKEQAQVFTSNATVYTGIATGSSIVSLEESKLDLFGTRTAFDNFINIIKSRSTIEEVGLRLFASHMLLSEPKDELISRESYINLMRIVPDDVKALVVKNNYEKTYQNLKNYKDKDHRNFIYGLIHFNHNHYSSKKLGSRIKVSRVQSSDMVELKYEADDPGICKQTLEILIDVFISEYSGIKANQSDAVVKYFLGQLDIANERLNRAENELLRFNQANNIINYYEQTKHVASEKEHFDLTYQDIKMQHAAAASVIKILENKMSMREKTKVNSQDIISMRNRLASVNLEIGMLTNDVSSNTDGEQALINRISELQNLSYNLQQQLRTLVKEQYNIDNSTEGVPTTSILQDWLEKVIEYEATEAQLKVGDEKLLDFKRQFENYAPLGATMKRLERKINVAEREYLSLLQSLSLAKLKQQNVELNSNIKTVAAPFYPIEAQPSKRKFLLIIAFMIGGIIPTFSIIVLEFLDRNIKNVYRAKNMIGLEIAAIFPKLTVSKNLDFDFVKMRGLDVISRRLILNTEQSSVKNKPDINLFFSILDGEGKTLMLTHLLEKLVGFGYKILLFTPDQLKEDFSFQTINYTINNSFHRVETVSDLEADLSGIDLNQFDYVFIEIPGILNHSYPINLFRTSSHSFLVTRSNRAWTKSDDNALNDILEFTKENKPQVLLNGVEIEEMENVLGNLPKRRTFIRRFIKNVLLLQFFSKSKINSSEKAVQVIKDEKEKRSIFKRLGSIGILIIVALFILVLLVGVKVIYPRVAKVFEKDVQKEKTQDEVIDNLDKSNAAEYNQSDEKVLSQPITPNSTKTITKPVMKYYVIGETFRNEENAQQLFNNYQRMGYKPYVFGKEGDIYKVAVGVYNTMKEAEKVQKEFLRYVPNSDVWILSELKFD
jgi:succinoglycan biosynthesis transport protein ExoP